ncbi:MAG: STAS/SEC14 domain-containing protein [SAR324 cluster bacterium]|nr:STAS/SEC14 domain-containing protein [SAR324 cluster bacterium]
MPVIQLEAQLSSSQLLQAVAQMPEPELEQFVAEVMALRARLHTSTLSESESKLLNKINLGIPELIQSRYDELMVKRQNESLAGTELQELLNLTDQVEKLEAERVEALAELAQIRGVQLAELMKNLGIPRHV